MSSPILGAEVSPSMEHSELLEDEHKRSQNLVPASFWGRGVRTGKLQLQEGLLPDTGLPPEARERLFWTARPRLG